MYVCGAMAFELVKREPRFCLLCFKMTFFVSSIFAVPCEVLGFIVLVDSALAMFFFVVAHLGLCLPAIIVDYP